MAWFNWRRKKAPANLDGDKQGQASRIKGSNKATIQPEQPPVKPKIGLGQKFWRAITGAGAYQPWLHEQPTPEAQIPPRFRARSSAPARRKKQEPLTPTALAGAEMERPAHTASAPKPFEPSGGKSARPAPERRPAARKQSAPAHERPAEPRVKKSKPAPSEAVPHTQEEIDRIVEPAVKTAKKSAPSEAVPRTQEEFDAEVERRVRQVLEERETENKSRLRREIEERKAAKARRKEEKRVEREEFLRERFKEDFAGVFVQRFKSAHPYRNVIPPLDDIYSNDFISVFGFNLEQANWAVHIHARAVELANMPVDANGNVLPMSEEEINRRWEAYKDLAQEFKEGVYKFMGEEKWAEYEEKVRKGEAHFNARGFSEHFTNQRAKNFENFRRAAVKRRLWEFVWAIDRGGVDFVEFLIAKGFDWKDFYYDDENHVDVERQDAVNALIQIARENLHNHKHGENLGRLLHDLEGDDDYE